MTLWAEIFLPTGYPESVTADYMPYQIWDSFQALFSSITGMISNQAVLQTMGVGNASATPLSATLTWVLQDGTGMVGRILFAYKYAAQMDKSIKFYRFLADILNDMGMILSLISPYVQYPKLVLCIGAISQSLCGVCGGSTRFALTRHFAKNGSVGDISAKDGSQETIVNLGGMILGSLILPLLSNDDYSTAAVFVVFTFMHLYCNYRAVSNVTFETINSQRLELLLRHYAATAGILNPEEVSSQESILLWDLMHMGSWKLSMSGENEDELQDAVALYLARTNPKLFEDGKRESVGIIKRSPEKLLELLRRAGWQIEEGVRIDKKNL